MKEVAQLLNEMVAAGILSDYAVFGAVAQMYYTEAVVTLDAAILISIPDPNRLDLLTPIHAFCAERGYQSEGDAIRVGAARGKGHHGRRDFPAVCRTRFFPGMGTLQNEVPECLTSRQCCNARRNGKARGPHGLGRKKSGRWNASVKG
ncbi:MAG: hypothetical protein WC789_05490 [Lentisphaeria bacterium]|jgi:hypothetical protein